MSKFYSISGLIYFFRSFEITLKCDEAEYPGETEGVKEVDHTNKGTDYVCQSVVNKKTSNLFNEGSF